MRRFVIAAILVLINAQAFSQNAERDSVKTKVRKNVIRHEVLGKSPYMGLLYERLLIHKKTDFYVSIGAGIGDTRNFYVAPSMFNLALYVKTNKWKINPVLGFGSFVFVEYRPYPATKAERDVFRETGGDGGPPLKPPFTFIAFIMAGTEIKISSRWNFQILYTPIFSINEDHWFLGYSLNSYMLYSHFGGINFGYKI